MTFEFIVTQDKTKNAQRMKAYSSGHKRTCKVVLAQFQWKMRLLTSRLFGALSVTTHDATRAPLTLRDTSIVLKDNFSIWPHLCHLQVIREKLILFVSGFFRWNPFSAATPKSFDIFCCVNLLLPSDHTRRVRKF